MIKYFISAFTAIMLLAGCSDNSTPQEGNKYVSLTTPIEGAPVVTEMFSLTCGHCRNMEKMLPAIKEGANVKIMQNHVTFNESAKRAAFVYFTALSQTEGEVSEAMMEDLFAYHQDVEEGISDDARKNQLIELFQKYQMKSPFHLDEAEREQVATMVADAEEFEIQAEIQSVPAFVVQGKYLVNTGAHESLDDMINTIKYLSTLGVSQPQ